MNPPLEDVMLPSPSQSEAREIIIAPSLIAADWWRIEEQVRAAEEAGCRWLHFDAMDGRFVSNITLGPMFLEALRPHCELHFDAHLMIENPSAYLDDFIQAGANSVSVHVENQPHLHRLLSRIKDGGALAGAVLNPSTPVAALEAALPDVDFVLVMSVNPGFSGQQFLPLATQKLARLREMREENGLQFLIQVDGGVGPETAREVVRAGADVLVCGSSVFNSKLSVAESVRALREAMEVA